MSPSTLRRFVSAATAFLLIARAAAATPEHTLIIDSSRALAAGSAKNFAFRIHAQRAEFDETDLRFREAAGQIKTALSAGGFFEARDDASAGFIVELDYGTEPGTPLAHKRYAPIYSRDHRLQVPLPDPADPTGWADLGRNPPDTLDDGSRLIGYSIVSFPVATTKKFLALTVHENGPAIDGRPLATLWHVVVSLEDTSGTLRQSLPMLAAGVMTAIERRTQGAAKLALRDDDSAVKFIAKGM